MLWVRIPPDLPQEKENMTGIIENIRYFFSTFLKEARGELNQVVWLDRKKTFAMTGLVLVVAVIIASFLGLTDVILGKLIELVL